jgi:hypothetical protein
VSAGAELNVLAPKRGEFAIAQTGLNGDEEQRPIPCSDPGARVRRRHESSGLFLGEKLDRPTLVAFRGDRKDALALEGKCGFIDGDEAEEGVQCRQTGVTGACRVGAILFEVSKEFLQEGGIQCFHVQFARPSLELLRGIAQQQAEGVAVARHRMWADRLLLDQAVSEKPLQEAGDARSVHGSPPDCCTQGYPLASWRSSGTASIVSVQRTHLWARLIRLVF